ncbi:response regulator transcription factor [Pseudonocardia xishanensis]|uniref:response regulator transcription factor n=1 Tax=Pseudonocardia xishanensis TaxID=630995 RepID=UPI0031E58A0B
MLIADDHPLVIAGVRAVLERHPDEFTVVATCHDGRDVLSATRSHRPDIALLDVRLGDLDGSEVAKAVLDECPGLRVVIVTAFDEPTLLSFCLDIGVAGILLKGSLNLDLAAALRDVRRGEVVIDDTVLRTLRTAGALLECQEISAVPVRPREVEILRLMAMGMATKDVANELNLSVNTVRSYTQALMAKLGAHNRVQAILQARRLHLI